MYDSVGSLEVGVDQNLRLSLWSGLSVGSGIVSARRADRAELRGPAVTSTVLDVEVDAGTARSSARCDAGTANTSARSAAIVSADPGIDAVGVSDVICCCLVW